LRLLTRVPKWSALKAWGMKLVKRKGKLAFAHFSDAVCSSFILQSDSHGVLRETETCL
jgi:hypothetical protein